MRTARAIGVVAVLLVSSAALGFDRSALQAVIAGCRLNATITSSPFPCLKVEKPKDAANGYAVLREPGDRARTILTPLAPISGIEDPSLLEPGAVNWFAKAWLERFSVARAFPAKDPWSDMALAINSQAGRTQDHLHIHIGCIDASVKDDLVRRTIAVNPNRFGYLNFRLQGRRYRAKRIEADSLDNLNPFDLVAREVPVARENMGRISIAVIGAVLPGEKKGFFILVDQSQPHGRDGPSAETLLDPTCSTAR